MIRSCVLVGGAGAVGGMFAKLLTASGIAVDVVDPSVDGRTVADVDPSAADMVMLAVPERVALAALPGVSAAMRPDALLVDTLSVKGRIAAIAPDRQMVSLNPMFAPSLGMAGRPVAAVVLGDGPAARELLAHVETWGGRVVRTDADTHDKLTAAAQVLTHAAVLGFGHALAAMNLDITQLSAIAPPPHTTMLALLARITSGTPEVYWDVQAANPYAPQARQHLADGIRAVADAVEQGTEADFAALLARMAGALGPDMDHYRDLCARLFTVS